MYEKSRSQSVSFTEGSSIRSGPGSTTSMSNEISGDGLQTDAQPHLPQGVVAATVEQKREQPFLEFPPLLMDRFPRAGLRRHMADHFPDDNPLVTDHADKHGHPTFEHLALRPSFSGRQVTKFEAAIAKFIQRNGERRPDELRFVAEPEVERADGSPGFGGNVGHRQAGDAARLDPPQAGLKQGVGRFAASVLLRWLEGWSNHLTDLPFMSLK